MLFILAIMTFATTIVSAMVSTTFSLPIFAIPILWALLYILLIIYIILMMAIKCNCENFTETIISNKSGGCTKNEILWNGVEEYFHIEKGSLNVDLNVPEDYEGDVEIECVEYKPVKWVRKVSKILTFKEIPSEWNFTVNKSKFI